MESQLLKACEGKTASQGGMNVNDLKKLAKSRGYTGSMKRENLTPGSKLLYKATKGGNKHIIIPNVSKLMTYPCTLKSD